MSARGRSRALLLGSLLVVAASACGREARHETPRRGDWVPLHPRTQEPALAALFLEGTGNSGYPENDEHLPLVIAVWADGTVLWRKAEHAVPGHAYRIGGVDPAVCEHLLATLEGIMHERNGKQCSYRVFDTTHDILVVRNGESLWSMTSCIDRFEKNSDLVATSRGIESRNTRNPPPADTAAELELKGFRAAWGGREAVPPVGDTGERRGRLASRDRVLVGGTGTALGELIAAPDRSRPVRRRSALRDGP